MIGVPPPPGDSQKVEHAHSFKKRSVVVPAGMITVGLMVPDGTQPASTGPRRNCRGDRAELSLGQSDTVLLFEDPMHEAEDKRRVLRAQQSHRRKIEQEF